MTRSILVALVVLATAFPGTAWSEHAGQGSDDGGAAAEAGGHGEAAVHARDGEQADCAGHDDHRIELPLWSVIPFVIMLLCIAVLPLTYEHWWEKNRNKMLVACVLGVPVGGWFLLGLGSAGQHELLHIMLEYASFMFLLGSLYVISGGILLRGDLPATPRTNTAFLAVGTLLASFMGTTGAAMLLIRPLLTTNRDRRHKVHTVIFFTFLVANIGGSLTPLGDPPLFMGYLRGVPFGWTFSLTPMWAFTSLLLLAVYYLWDRWQYGKEKAEDLKRDRAEVEKLSVRGVVNVPLLAGVVASVAFGAWLNSALPSIAGMVGCRELIMGLLALASWKLTKKKVRSDNEFTFAPILEVAALFFGIFLTMIPAVVLLKTRGGELPVTEPWHFFWATGVLSAFLDNTPTYCVFFELGASGLDPGNGSLGLQMATERVEVLRAISLGAVFLGAMTYIGNGPNFMVKAISDERGVKMPSFFGYMIYSCLILVPVFVLVTLLFV